jgi:hypothetical protein
MVTTGSAAAAVTTWWMEYENGDRSADYDSEPEVWAALVELPCSEEQARPRWLCSSDGDRFAIP